MTLKHLGWVSAVVASLALVGVLVIATYVPPVHPIHAADARDVDTRDGGSLLPYTGRVPAATTSLEELRCALWRELKQQRCGDVTALAQRFWPWLTQTPETLYWPLASAGGISPVSGPSGYNVEYQAGLRRLVVHQYVSQPLFVMHHVDATVGAALAPGLELLMLSTAGMFSGVASLREDFWIERITGDEANGDERLGMVEIP